jgi:pimeloyl-ACP methyl ester carboxylesterase/DNA-binding CsgD family transcriptional regulator
VPGFDRAAPGIRYATTADGVSIAYWALGHGRPLISMPTVPHSHIGIEYEDATYYHWYSRLAGRTTLVRYDNRNSGLSDRGVTDMSLDAHVRDLEAVVERLGLRQFDLFAKSFVGPVALAYCHRHPERVEHLALWHSFARTADFLDSAYGRAIFGLLGDRDLFVNVTSRTASGWADGREAEHLAALFRESVTQDEMQAIMAEMHGWDVRDLLPEIRTPVLVMHRRQYPALDLAVSRKLVAAIPNAELVVLEGEAGTPWVGDTEAVVDALFAFVAPSGHARDTAGIGGLERRPRERPEGAYASTGGHFSAREIEVLRLIADGLSNYEIAEQISVSLSTVKTHINNVYNKLDVRSRTEAVARARSLNLL